MQISVNGQCANWNVFATCGISYKVKDYLPKGETVDWLSPAHTHTQSERGLANELPPVLLIHSCWQLECWADNTHTAMTWLKLKTVSTLH